MARNSIIQPNRAAELQAMKSLQELASQMFKNGTSIAKLAATFADGMHAGKAIAAVLRHVYYEGVGSSECRAIADAFTAQQPPEIRRKRLLSRRQTERQCITTGLKYSGETAPGMEWTRNSVLATARKRQAVINSALAAIEREGDAAHNLLNKLAQFLTGDAHIDDLERCCKSIGYTPNNNVVAFVPAKR